jgi:peroxiredoxin
MKNLLLIFLVTCCFTSIFAQTKRKNIPLKKTIIYKNVKGEVITKLEYLEELSANEFRFEKIFEDAKTIELKLKENLNENTPFADFTATDLDGKTIDTKQLRGKVIVLNFWFTTCTGCVQEMPDLNKIVAKYKDNENVVFLALSFNTASEVKRFLTAKPFNYQHITGEKTFVETYKYNGEKNGFPANIIVGKDGKVARWLSNIFFYDKFEARIQAELAKDYKSASTNL